MGAPVRYASLDAGRGYWTLLAALAAAAAAGFAGFLHLEREGHWITGMNNQVVWGLPHVFAVFLIVAASGALNAASLASVFGRAAYKPLARLSALLAAALLVGGLLILVLDLGRPDRLVVAMTYYNFKSIFAWNIFLYTGLLAVLAAYLAVLFQPALARWTRAAGLLALAWRLILTTGTGAIFGFLVAREAYDAAILSPLFVILSFAFGTAAFLLTLAAACRLSGRPLGDALLFRLRDLLALFVLAALYFTLAHHLTALYATEHHGFQAFVLDFESLYSKLFWLGQVGLGALLPLLLFYLPAARARRGAAAAGAALVIAGGLAQLYVLIIGGQAYPLALFPGMEERSSFYDGVVASYAPSGWEFLLGLAGVAVAGLVLLAGLGALGFLPEDLSDPAEAAAG